MYYRFFFLLLNCLIGFKSLGQSNIPIGTWRTHLSYNSVETVEVAEDRIYAGSSNSAFYLENGVFHELSKLTGLSDVDVTKIRFHEKTNTVIFGYENGNIDLIVNKNTIINLNDVVRADIQGSKRINEIQFHDNLAFLSTDFGVVVLDLIKREVKETYQNFSSTSEILKVNATAVFEDTIYVCTKKGLYVSKYSNTNLMDFSTWRNIIPVSSVESKEATGAAVYNNSIYIGFRTIGIFHKENANWKQAATLPTNQISTLAMRPSFDKLLYCAPTVYYIQNKTVIPIPPTTQNSRDAVYDRNGNLFVADSILGLMIYSVGGQYNSISANGPNSSEIFNLIQANRSVYKLAGGYNSAYTQFANNLPVDKFTNGSWESSYLDNNSQSLVDMAYNPVNGKYYYCSYLSGLIVQSPDNIKVYDSDNSPLVNVIPGLGKMIRASSVAVEEDGDVWVGNYALSQFYQLFKLDINDNFIGSYTLTNQQNSPLQIIIDDFENLWIRGSARSIMIFNEKKNSIISSSQIGGLKNSSINTISKDNKGEIWVGTDGGIGVYNDPGLLYQQRRPDFTTPYFAGFPLLYDKVITSIKVDAANRKWIGTTSGVWLMNESGTEIIHYFNVDNSPLLSNDIKDIEIEPITGEVFIGTDRGLVSYRGNATEVNPNGKFENVNIFPNPITPGYTGEVAISGLAVNETDVKITDMFGNLVFETKSTGGTATWNLKDYNGKKAKPGMYLVFNITPDGVESIVSKMAIVD